VCVSVRRYNEAIEVRQGLVGDDEGPAQFLWRHRLWKVLELQTRWVETADWWNSAQVRAARGDLTGTDPAGSTSSANSDPTNSRSTNSKPNRTRSGAAESRPRPLASTGADNDEGDDLLGEQEIWRVVAADGRFGTSGVYELARSWGSGRWRLRTVVD